MLAMVAAGTSQAQTIGDPGVLVCPAGSERVAHTFNAWTANSLTSGPVTLTAASGATVNMEVSFTNRNPTYRNWGPSMPGGYDQAVLSAFFNRPPADALLVTHNVNFTEPVTHFRYVVYNSDARHSGPAYIDSYVVTTSSGAPVIQKFAPGYNTIDGLRVTGTKTPSCPSSAPCPDSRFSVMYNEVPQQFFQGQYRAGFGTLGSRTASDTQFIGFNRYEACLPLPSRQFNLAKTWSGGTSGDTAVVTLSGAAAGASMTSVSTGGGGQTGSPGPTVSVPTGTTVTLPVETGNNIGNYTQAVYCTGGTTLGSPSAPISLPRTITIGSSAAATVCTYVNTRTSLDIRLGKAWSNGLAGNRVNLAISGPGVSGATTGNSTVGGATSNATATATAGSTVTLAESFTTGNAANYNTTLACSKTTDGSAVAVTGSGGSRTLVMPSDSAVTCTYTNSRIAQQINLAKTWVNAVSGHTASATATNSTAGGSGPSFTSTAPANTTGTAVTVHAGDVLTLPAETFGGGATASTYTSTLACTGGSTLASGTTGRTLTIAGSTTPTTCRYTNTLNARPVTLTKAWINGKPSDAVSLTISGTGAVTATGSSVVGGATSAASTTAPAGGVVTLAEAFTTGSPGNYTTTLACTAADGVTSVPVNGTGLSRTMTVPAGQGVNCTYTNARIAQQLNLAKNWVNARAGHTATASTSGGTNNPTFSSTAPDNTTGAAVTVYAGDVVTLPAETFGNGATAAVYDTVVACAGGSPLASGSTGRTVTVAANSTATSCTYTNSLRAADLSITKVADREEVIRGSDIIYTVVASNRGPLAADGAIVSDEPGAGLDVNQCEVTSVSASAGAVVPATPSQLLAGGVAIPAFPAGSSITFIVRCTVP